MWLLENDLDSELCYSGPPATRLRDWVDPRRLMIMGAFEAAVGPEAPYAYVLSLDTALAKAFCERAFRLAPLRLLALAHLLAKGDIEAQLVALRSNLQQRTQNLACALTAQFAQRVVLEPRKAGACCGCASSSRWPGMPLPRPWQVAHCMHCRGNSSACTAATGSTWR